ncbi:aromatic-L-amino-acid decarboxylase [Octopus sinensis]|uniref:Aromatic-L-amino-acid decarboxylase n=1 Tax=Octopus sinensis TaxID=2607531 RepID=A0A6P7S4N7_9MOLL|nr:aromatic-L-amino-acid decarboxylase [Octopus sinensis]
MDSEEFQVASKQMIKFVADYLENSRERRVLPDVKPGFMRPLLPDHAPEDPEKWEDLFKDIEKVIMPGVTHWQHPKFFAYFPTGCSYSSIVADILSDAIACIGFSWASCPSCTELEVIVLDWLAKALKLPDCFLSTSDGPGGAVIQGTASEATLVAVLSARTKFLRKLKEENPGMEDGIALTKLVAYNSIQSHSSVERAFLIALVKHRSLNVDDKRALRGETLRKAIKEDKAKGLIPFFVCGTLGTTSTLSFDNIEELGLICKEENIWMHIDAAFAGSAFICPEYRPLLNGVEHAESFNFNPHKWLQVNFDCSAMWIRDSRNISQAFTVDPVYLKHENENEGIMPDYRHWHVPLGRRFRSLKLWFVLRLFGIKKLQEIIRRDIKLAVEFKKLIEADARFEIFGEVIMSLVCFRLKGSNEINEQLVKDINNDGRIHLVPSKCDDTFFLRFSICSNRTTYEDVQHAYKVITEIVEKILKNSRVTLDSK